MKTLYTLMIALLTLNVVNAQLPVKETWTRALLSSELQAGALGIDTIHKSITDVQADSLINANDTNENFIILDVRTPDEFKLGHIKNAENINFFDSNFNAMLDELDRDMSYLVYCGVGGRSAQVFNKMVSKHFREVYDMLGGFSKWKTDGFPFEVDTTTNIINYQLLTKNIKVYPNPASEKVMIEINQPMNRGTISIFNSNGQEQITQQINESASEINISNLPAGVYMLRLVTDKTIGVGRFIKQ